MTIDLRQIEYLFSKLTNRKITAFVIDNECAEYFGCSFKLDELQIKFRQAKITPKKVGLFVTLWKRNAENKTEPYTIKDPFDFYIIAAKQENDFGFFVFPKDILSDKNILTNSKKEGKRGFRIYPYWAKTDNNLAAKTKAWQTNYFINCNENNDTISRKLNNLLNKS